MYISDSVCISPQPTFDGTFFEGNTVTNNGIRYQAIEPDYAKFIPAGLLRRMGKAIRMGVGAGLPLIERAQIEGFILGTANGGLEDCLKFLNQIVDYDEGTLTPTNFVQSTPNAVAGNLALMSKNHGYNTTHVHHGLAFEAALLDAALLLEEQKAQTLLVGTVEEISDYNHNIDFLSGAFKMEDLSSDSLIGSDTSGSVNGEGAVMFVIDAHRKSEHAVHIKDMYQSSYLPGSNIEERVISLLSKNGLAAENIDTLILGISGDNRTDHLYTNLQSSLFSRSNSYCYKNLVGDYPTSSAFATWLGVQLLNGKTLPDACVYKKSDDKTPQNVLIYNHFRGLQHSFILLGK